MKTIRMLTTAAGSWRALAGDVIEKPDQEASELVAGGYAEYIEPESAALAGGETATLPRPSRKGRSQ